VPFEDVTPALFDRIFHINVRGAFFCAQRAVPWMVQRGGGSILNVASIHAHSGVPGHAVYAASKGAVVALTRELAIELAPQRLRVNAVAPGHTEVERHRADPDYSPERGAAMVPWGRPGRPEDVAKAVVYLVSDEAEMVTGQVLYVDGGTTAKLALNTSHISKD
jgi:glucose 1-dehydrogenase/3-oxoacyl-[acyl-carrier protein] reductase